MDTFYIIWNQDCGRTRPLTYKTQDEAVRAALYLASVHFPERFYVLEAKALVVGEARPVTIKHLGEG